MLFGRYKQMSKSSPLLLGKCSAFCFFSIKRMSLKDLGVVKLVFPNVVYLQTSSHRASVAVAALGPVAAHPYGLEEAWLLPYSIPKFSLGSNTVLPHLIKP